MPSDEVVTFFKSCNVIENPFNDDDNLPSINSNYMDLSNFNELCNSQFIQTSLGILHLNIASLNKYCDDLNDFLTQIKLKFKIMGISEHKIKADNYLYFPLPGYNFIYNPCTSTHGGTGFFLSNDISYQIRKDLNINKLDELESTVVEILLKNNKNLICCCIYKHPHMSISEFLDEYLSVLLNKLSHENKFCIIMGDFNINLLNCETNQAYSNFYQLLSNSFFIPYILQPTRITATSTTLIDNIFFNSPEFHSISGNFTSQISDHLTQFLVLKEFFQKRNYTATNTHVRSFKYFNEDEFRNDLKNKVSENNEDFNDVNTPLKKLYNTIISLLDEQAPIRTVTKREASLKAKPWINKEILHDMTKRDRLFKKYCTLKNPKLKEQRFEQYKLVRNLIKTKILAAKGKYFENYFNNYRTNVAKVWDGIKTIISLKAKQNSLPTTLSYNDNLIQDPQKIANIFVDFFTNIGSDIAKKIPKAKKSFKSYMGNNTLNSFYLKATTTVEIEKIIKSFKKGKSLGPNSIPIKILKYNADILAPTISKLVNHSFNTGEFPEFCKIAKVIPVFKRGDNLNCSNYRPISLLSILSKIFEKCMSTRLYSFLQKYKLIFQNQFGFRPKCSTYHALLSLIETIKTKIDVGEYVCGVFIDLQKAFDTVDHEILLQKLYMYGIRGKANKWFQSFLTNRKQYVTIGNYSSDFKTVQCGVPQGSTLGPLLFLIYINDLHFAFEKILVHHFADDTNLIFSSKNLATIESVMNCELKTLVDWLHANKLSLNEAKTEMIVFRRSLNQKISDNFTIKINKFKLSPLHYVKYLGVFIDETLNWNYQIEQLSQKLAKSNGIISKLRHYIPQKSCLSIYFSIFYSHLLHVSTVWQFTSKDNINKIFMLQKHCIRLMTFSELSKPTSSLFHSLKILKLEDIFRHQTLNFMLDFHNDITPDAFKNYFTYSSVRHKHHTRNLNLFYVPSYNFVNYGKNCIRNFGPRLWNHFYKNVSNFRSKINAPKLQKEFVKSYLLDSY